MDPELTAWTVFGQFKKVRDNFWEIERRLIALEKENRDLKKRLAALEATLGIALSDNAAPPGRDRREKI
jgi:chaperonin cofactor prefoldin